jgi:GNAT superfamily N-acetyltransferase
MLIASLAERPDLEDALWDMPTAWPEFMRHDPVSNRHYPGLTEFPHLQLVALDENGAAAAKVHAVPLEWSGAADLPARGWDAVLEDAFDRTPEAPEAVSLIEAHVRPDLRGRGMSPVLIEEMRHRALAMGIRHLVAPVRPSQKSSVPRVPMHEYVTSTRADGLPRDSWLRVHARLGGRISHVCPLSMTIPGTLDQWRSWTGLPFAESGDVEVPSALVPVHVDVEADHAVYVEPNVWVHHELT